MDKERIREMHRKILEGLTIAYERLIDEKKKNDDSVAVYRNGKVQIIKARDIESNSADPA